MAPERESSNDHEEVRSESPGDSNASAPFEEEEPTPALPPVSPVPGPGEHPSVARTLRGDDIVAARFRILRRLGGGGMGEVFEAEDFQLRERVALKFIRWGSTSEPGSIERLKREVRLARRISHPNVCRLFDIGTHRRVGKEGLTHEQHFIIMEFLQGETLSRRLKREGRFTVDRALPLVRQMVEGLEAAHAAEVIHRDFKSNNILLVDSPDGHTRVVIIDFDLSRSIKPDESYHTLPGSFVGTPAYMAPEQVEGKPITPASDVYALGVVLYEMLTGTLPFKASTQLAVASMRLTQEPPSPRQHVPDLDPRWEALILGCMARDPAGRLPSARAVLDRLTLLETPLPVPRQGVPDAHSQPVGRGEAGARQGKARASSEWWVWVLLVLGGLVLFVTTGAGFTDNTEATGEPTTPPTDRPGREESVAGGPDASGAPAASLDGGSRLDAHEVFVYTMDEVDHDKPSVGLVRDRSPNGNYGTYRGVRIASGKFGEAYDFRMADHWISVPDVVTSNRPEGTLTMWVNLRSYGGGAKLFVKNDPGVTTEMGLILATSTGHVKFTTSQSGGTTELRSNRSIPLGRWAHLAASWGPQGKRLYIDGVLDAADGDPVGLGSASRLTYIGNDPNNAYERGVDGFIDEVRFYSVALRPDEIEAMQ